MLFDSKESFQNGLKLFLETEFDAENIKELTRKRYDLSIILPSYKNVFNNEQQ